MPTTTRTPSRAGRVAAVIVVATVVLLVLMLAGVPPVAHLAGLAGALVALAVVGVERARRRRPLPVTLLAAPFIAGAALTAASLAPLPHAVRALVAPEGTDRVDRLARLLSAEAAAALRPVLAFDPPEAALSLLRLLLGVVVVVVVGHVSRSREGRAALFRAVLVGSFVVGFAVLFAEVVGIPRVLDVFGVPVNANHRARVCGALSLLCLGRAAGVRVRLDAAWFAVAGVGLALLMFATLSKGAIVAFVAAVVVGVVVVVRGADSGAARVAAPAGALVVIVAGGAFVGVRALSVLGAELNDPQRLKTFLWEPALRVASVEPFVGVGGGGFAGALPSLLAPGELEPDLTYTHPENIVLQTLADHGAVPGALLLLLCLGVAVVVARALRGVAALAAAPAVVFLLVGDLFDFVTETPAGMALLALALGLLGGRLAAARRPLARVTPRALAVGAVVVVVAAAAVAPAAVGDWRYRQDAQVAQRAGAGRVALLERALATHPSDATFATALAQEARRRRDPQAALRFANRALVLWPSFRPAHLEAARALFAVGRPAQGLLEYREVWRSGGDVVREVVARTDDPVLRRLALPEPLDGARLARLCDVLVVEGRADDARACLGDAVALPDAPDAARRSAIALALAAHDVAAARALLDGMLPPFDGEDAVAAATVVAAEHAEDGEDGKDGKGGALVVTDGWLPLMKHPVPLLEWRLREQRRLRAWDDAELTLRRLRASSHSAGQAARFDLALVELRRQRGDNVGALGALSQALAARPRDLSLLLMKVRLELAAGDVVSATITAGQMRSIAPGDKRVDAAVGLLPSTTTKR